MDNITNTKAFLSEALLYPNTITCTSEIIDLLPIIDKYYNYLIKVEKCSICKHFDLNICRPDLEKFEQHGDKFINECIEIYKSDIPHLTKDSVYSLILNTAITLKRIDIIENILSTFHEENILTYTDQTGFSPISCTLSYGNEIALNLIKSYIQRYNYYIIKVKSMREEDHDDILSSLKYLQFENMSSYRLYNEYLVHLYKDEALTKIKELVNEDLTYVH